MSLLRPAGRSAGGTIKECIIIQLFSKAPVEVVLNEKKLKINETISLKPPDEPGVGEMF